MSETVPFASLGLGDALLRALDQLGFNSPTEIQQRCIPPLLRGQDLIGQAQTGTGKTAAFVLPILQQLNASGPHPQALVLTPTRELALQVSEAFAALGQSAPATQVVCLYGGQAYHHQLKALKRGVSVVVGTPGRVMDHIRRGTLQLESLRTLVLDEADEMLRMGFVDDVEWILGHTPEARQLALFSATMPKAIERLARSYLRDPQRVQVDAKSSTVSTVRQRHWVVQGINKAEALGRILEVEPADASIVFVRTKQASTTLTDQLLSRGLRAAALNGDLSQDLRERTLDALKRNRLDVLVATDVAARGLDVDRITHVFNYDIPNDAEAYVHRIGRTGRAGRTGEAVLFVMPKERHRLRSLERALGVQITPMQLPSGADIERKRMERFAERVRSSIEDQDLAPFQALLAEIQQASGKAPDQVAAALLYLAQESSPLQVPPEVRPSEARTEHKGREKPGARHNLEHSGERQTYRLEVGREHGVLPKHIVGAIANEAGIDGKHIGHIRIRDHYSTVDLPSGMPDEVFRALQRTRVCQQPLRLSVWEGQTPSGSSEAPKSRGKKETKAKFKHKPSPPHRRAAAS